MVVSSVALIIALGGTSYAASKITSAQIKNNTIKSADIKNNSVTSTDVKNSSLKGTDVKNDSLTGDDINESTIGKVPKAGSAESATQAVNAGALGGFGPTSLIRTAFDNVPGAAVTNTTGATTAASANIAAPTSGYLTITASSDTYNGASDSIATCWIEYDGTEVDASEREIELDGAVGVNTEENCDTNVTIPTKAGVHNIAFVADPNSVDITFDETALSVIFTPFGNDGTQPTSFTINKGAKKASHKNK
jgi:hypothetical protein